MAVDGVSVLRDLGFTVQPGREAGAWRLTDADGRSVDVRPCVLERRVTSHLLRRAQRSGRRALVLCPSVTPSVKDHAMAGDVDLVTEDPPLAIVRGRVYHSSEPAAAIEIRPRRGRPAWFAWAVQRLLVVELTPLRQSQIGERLGTSQQTVSHAVKSAGELLANDGHGIYASDRRALAAQWREEYPGPGGSRFGWYSLEPPVAQVHAAACAAERLGAHPIISGDVAADRLAPWLLPRSGFLYIDSPVDLTDEGFVPAPLDEATLVACVPRDRTLWKTSTTEAGIGLADPALVWWELMGEAREDSNEAAEQLLRSIIEARA